jgi:hypothetical protein
MSEQLEQDVFSENQEPPSHHRGTARKHPLTLENTPEKTLEIMRAFPERAEQLRELVRGLREKDAG